MKYLLHVSIPLFLISVITCCTENIVVMENDQKGEFNSVWTLKKVGTKKFELDSVTSIKTGSVQYFRIGKAIYYSQLNPFNNSIYIYDFSIGGVDRVVRCSEEGDNGVGNVSGHHVINFDSIFVYSYSLKKLSLIDDKGKVFFTKYLRKEKLSKGKYMPTPNLATNMPIILLGDHIYMSGSINGEYEDEDETNRPVVVSFDCAKGELDCFFSYPESYRKGKWFGRQYRKVYSVFNPKNKLFVYSFPNDHYLYLTDHKSERIRKYAGSQYFNGIESTNKHWYFDKARSLDFFQNQPSYSSIIYDKFRDCYYRLAEHPMTDSDTLYRKPISVVLLDGSLKWKGEYVLPDQKHSQHKYFVAEEGLYISRAVNEDSMTYYVYEIQNLEIE